MEKNLNGLKVTYLTGNSLYLSKTHALSDSQSVVEFYKYLGITIDKSLIIKELLEETFKNTLSRTNLLARIQHNISPCVAETIYKVMILPQMLYCSNILLGMSNTQKSQCERI